MKKKMIYFVVPLGIFLYLSVYLYSRNSEGFKFIKEEYLHSASIENRVGKVKSVELPLFGSFKEKRVNGKVLFTAKVRCVGEKGTVLVDVVAEKNPDWRIKQEDIN